MYQKPCQKSNKESGQKKLAKKIVKYNFGTGKFRKEYERKTNPRETREKQKRNTIGPYGTITF